MSGYLLTLNQIVSSTTLYIDYISLIFGTIGGICNVITFTGRKIHQSATVFYLLCGSIFQLFTVLFCVTTRLTFDRFSLNPQNYSRVLCKLRFYLVVTLPALATYFMLLATFDRFISTSSDARIRLWSQIQIARRLSLVTIFIILILSIHILIYYDLYNNMCNISPGSVYTFIFAGYVIIFVTILPHFLMLVFSFITLSAIRKSRQRIAAAFASGHQNLHRIEMKLVKIIMVQVVLSILVGLLRLGSYSYSILNRSLMIPGSNTFVIVSSSVQLGGSLYFFSFAISFYASMISSKFFRETFHERIRFFYHLFHRHVFHRFFVLMN